MHTNQNPNPTTLPLIDVAGLASPHRAERHAVALQLRAACRGAGFFYIRGHGVPAGLRAEVFAQAETFFARPESEKLRLDMARSPCNRGYQPMRGQTLQSGAPPDLKEGYYIGLDLSASDPRVAAGRFNHGENVWPADMPAFRSAMQAWFEAMQALAARLLRGLALALELEEHALDGYLESGGNGTLFLVHYPPQPADPRPAERGCGEHTDFDAFTILAQGEVGGLEVRDPGSERWIAAPPVEGAFVVNIGDLLARWSNGTFRSTLHRVVNRSGRERYSVPFFCGGHPDYRIECLASCLAPGARPKYPPVTVEQHLAECYARMGAKALPAAGATEETA